MPSTDIKTLDAKHKRLAFQKSSQSQGPRHSHVVRKTAGVGGPYEIGVDELESAVPNHTNNYYAIDNNANGLLMAPNFKHGGRSPLPSLTPSTDEGIDVQSTETHNGEDMMEDGNSVHYAPGYSPRCNLQVDVKVPVANRPDNHQTEVNTCHFAVIANPSSLLVTQYEKAVYSIHDDLGRFLY